MKREPTNLISSRAGYTLTEIMVATAISSLVLAGAMTIFVSGLSSWQGINLRMEADSDVNMIMSRIIYGTDGLLGVRSAALMQTSVTSSDTGWTIQYKTGGTPPQQNSIAYMRASKQIIFKPGDIVIGRDVTASSIVKNGSLITIKIAVEKKGLRQDALRELETTIACRNIY